MKKTGLLIGLLLLYSGIAYAQSKKETSSDPPPSKTAPASMNKSANTGAPEPVKAEVETKDPPKPKPEVFTPLPEPEASAKVDITEKPILANLAASSPPEDSALAPVESPVPEVYLPLDVPSIVLSGEAGRYDSDASAEKNPYAWDEYEVALVPAENRPPAERTVTAIRSSGLPPEAEISPISRIPLSASGGLPPEAEVPPLSRNPAGSDVSVMASGPAQVSPFPVPLISNLEKGKYYLQLIALRRPEQVELELIKIGQAYPLAVQSAGDFYRILVGPINQGESGALLQRFRGSYPDAFVRP
ncbi:MAG: SPOR domain-containing protein [Spirochaetaceae bacterium]|jgi:hypothetical protein|nr:SPOR domain-containing protein [Spirochaetaceae bacterium]